METTFMTIHSLSPEANTLYASDSVGDILGYDPEEIVGRSCFDYFHPDEVPFARGVVNRGVLLDKAAVLQYARIKNKNGEWIGCECVFTVVYEVLVACTSIYKGDVKSERRAAEAPAIRRLFASSPRDPRYYMLEHLSPKFKTAPQASLLEPRAALILNRFTRTLTVMYATNALTTLLGITPEQFKGKSFYECMQENCLADAIRCMESAKANDSIAYLRFYYRDPRRPEDFEDEEMQDFSNSSDSEDGGVELNSSMEIKPFAPSMKPLTKVTGRTSSEESGDSAQETSLNPNTIFDLAQRSQSSASSLQTQSEMGGRRRTPENRQVAADLVELEAVVSCTSDGLVVVLRRARPAIPAIQQPANGPRVNGLFAAPWAAEPIRPNQYYPDDVANHQNKLYAPQHHNDGPSGGDFMSSIRECGVFAWAVAGINGNLASYGRGTPSGEAQPPEGLPIWDPQFKSTIVNMPPENQAVLKRTREGEMINRPKDQMQQGHPLRQPNGFNANWIRATQERAVNHGYLESHVSPACRLQSHQNYYSQENVRVPPCLGAKDNCDSQPHNITTNNQGQDDPME